MNAPKAQSRNLLDYVLVIVIASLLALGIRAFVIEAYRIPSSAMRPTLEPGDTIFVSKFALKVLRQMPKQGDIIVFSALSPKQRLKRDYIKRVVALPGDRVAVKDGLVVLNGKTLGARKGLCGTEHSQQDFDYGICWQSPAFNDIAELKVPSGHLFVIGDLRTLNPNDPNQDWDRFPPYGLIPLGDVKGKAQMIWLSTVPSSTFESSGLFPRLRFERMLRTIK